MFLLLTGSLLIFPQILYGFPAYQVVTEERKNKTPSPVAITESVDEFDDDDNPFLELRDQIKVYLDDENPI